jgi:hypothetical protein
VKCLDKIQERILHITVQERVNTNVWPEMGSFLVQLKDFLQQKDLTMY